jgi:hypothetical protein
MSIDPIQGQNFGHLEPILRTFIKNTFHDVILFRRGKLPLGSCFLGKKQEDLTQERTTTGEEKGP